MNAHYFYHGKHYTFSWNAENNSEIIVNDGSRFYSIRCFNRSGYAIAINKRSVSADGSARGVFAFIADCIREDLMLVYVDRIIDRFCS